MCFITLLLLVSCVQFSFSSTHIKPYYSLGQAETLFQKFLSTYGKKYPTVSEHMYRLANFKNTLQEINFLNHVSRHAVFDINEFADLSKREFTTSRTGYKKNKVQQFARADPACAMFLDQNITTSNAPQAFDWRDQNKVTKVREQGKCGSCWAFSVIGNIESQYAILTNILYQFSPQQLVDCVYSSEGCDGGDNVGSARALISYGGVEAESDYPYKVHNQNCTFDASKIKAKVVACNNFDLKDENKLKEVLYKTGPLSIVLDAQMLSSYSGGVIDYCPQHEENHAVLLVGYGTEKEQDFWILKNSWGENWGEQGFFRLLRGINACGILNDKIVSTVLNI